jgi:hypothetical protein
VRQITALFSKNGDIDLNDEIFVTQDQDGNVYVGYDREKVTLDKLHTAEERCKESNAIFRAWQGGKFQFRPRVEASFHEAARLIATVLGDVPDLADLKFRFGPGATTGVTRARSSHIAKCEEELCCSEDLLPIVHHVLAEMPALVDAHCHENADVRWLREVRFWLKADGVITDDDDEIPVITAPRATVTVKTRASKLGFVPKNAFSLRTTCTQPSLSMQFQLGIGEILAVKLRSVGIDIRDQGKNQELARLGSLTGALATLDLISASDTVSTGLVQHLLPMAWYEFLAYGRTSWCELPSGRVIRLAQFSSMGNGFTFPLQTLIFWALTCTCVPKHERSNVSVYGDDIICPTPYVARVREILNAAGFWVNETKSYSTGSFRESCGADWLNGISVRPFYLKTYLSGMSLFTMHNFFRRRADDEIADLCLDHIDPSLQRFGPDGYGDGHLLQPSQGWGGWHETAGLQRDAYYRRKPGHVRSGFGGLTFSTYTTRARRETRHFVGDIVFPLYEVYVNGSLGEPQYNAVIPGTRRLHTNDAGPDYKWHWHRPIRKSLREHALAMRDAVEVRSIRYEEDGRPSFTLPGWHGYKEIRIYTLDR